MTGSCTATGRKLPLRASLEALVAAALISPAPAPASEEAPARANEPRPLYVSPKTAPEQRLGFVEALAAYPGSLYEIYDAWIDRIGANGILDGIHQLRPACHSEAHDLGKVIHARLQSIGDSLRACDRRCHSGCMHGVLMAAFTEMCSVDGRLKLELLAPAIEVLCMAEPQMRADYDFGDCAHGVGHALMFLADYSVPVAIAACGGFRDERMRYYCATGAYMEYVTDGHADQTLAEASFYPCDTHPYPAACARYLMPRFLSLLAEDGNTASHLYRMCQRQEGKRRVGCYHGIGNATSELVGRGTLSIADVCGGLGRDEEQVCIEGVMERMSRYAPGWAQRVCAQLEGPSREICDRATRGGMYRMDREPRLYTREDPLSRRPDS